MVSLTIKRIKRISETEYELEIEAKTRTSFKIGKEVKRMLEELAREKGMSLSDLIRESLNENIREIKDLGRDDLISINIRLDQLRELDKLSVKFNVPRTYIFHSKIAEYLKREGIKI